MFLRRVSQRGPYGFLKAKGVMGGHEAMVVDTLALLSVVTKLTKNNFKLTLDILELIIKSE